VDDFEIKKRLKSPESHPRKERLRKGSRSEEGIKKGRRASASRKEREKRRKKGKEESYRARRRNHQA